MGEVTNFGRAHCGRARRRLRPQLGRPEEQPRAHRRPLSAGGPRATLPRLGAWLRSETKAPAVRCAEEPGVASQPGRDVADRWRRKGALFNGAGHPGSRARVGLVTYHYAFNRATSRTTRSRLPEAPERRGTMSPALPTAK